MSLSDDQISYLRDIEKIPPEDRCYCAWFRLGECPHCPPGMTLADRLKVQCRGCGNYPPAMQPDQPIVHRIGCKATNGAERGGE